jgi:hypothetical protein
MPEHTNLGSIFPRDRERLRAFRKAAEGVYRNLGPYLSKTLTIQLGGSACDLIPEAPLKAGALGIRLAYLQKEPAHLPGIIDVLAMLKDPDVDGFASRVAAAWQLALKGRILMVFDHVHGYNSQAVFET